MGFAEPGPVSRWSAVITAAYRPGCVATTWNMPAGSGDQWPGDYERGRPGWPREAVEVHGLPRSATVLDLGAGTGKLTRLLVSRFDHVVAVEPADAMRRVRGHRRQRDEHADEQQYDGDARPKSSQPRPDASVARRTQPCIARGRT